MIFKVKDLFDYIRYDIPSGVRNLFIWFPIIWKNREYDHFYFLTLLKFKTSLIKKEFEKRYYFNEHRIKELKIISLLIDRINKDEYTELLIKNHEEKYGEKDYHFNKIEDTKYSEIIMTYKKPLSKDEIIKADKEYIEIIKKGVKQKNNDINYLFDIIKNKHQMWWN